jgi:hypothetical protein
VAASIAANSQGARPSSIISSALGACNSGSVVGSSVGFALFVRAMRQSSVATPHGSEINMPSLERLP